MSDSERLKFIYDELYNMMRDRTTKGCIKSVPFLKLYRAVKYFYTGDTTYEGKNIFHHKLIKDIAEEYKPTNYIEGYCIKCHKNMYILEKEIGEILLCCKCENKNNDEIRQKLFYEIN
jgi:hypothetical protein